MKTNQLRTSEYLRTSDASVGSSAEEARVERCRGTHSDVYFSRKQHSSAAYIFFINTIYISRSLWPSLCPLIKHYDGDRSSNMHPPNMFIDGGRPLAHVLAVRALITRVRVAQFIVTVHRVLARECLVAFCASVPLPLRARRVYHRWRTRLRPHVEYVRANCTPRPLTL